MNASDLETRRRKLLFRVQRRGVKEMDLIFGAFGDTHLAKLDSSGMDRLEALLDAPDWDVYGWVVGDKPVPPEYDNDIFALLRDYRANLHA